MPAPRVVVFAYGGFGCAGVDALARAGAAIVHGYSHADDPAEHRWWPSVAERIGALGAPCELDADLRDQGPDSALARLRALRPDFLFSFYFRKMIPERVLATAAQGGYNLHGSLLPRYRGRAPINWQLVNGEARSGLTLHRMVRSADAGDIVAQAAIAVPPDQDAHGLTTALLALAPAFLDGALPGLLAGRARHLPQDHSQATVFRGRTPDDGAIDWRWSARRIHDLVRAVAPPWPGAFSAILGQRVAIDRTAVAAEEGAFGAPGTVLEDSRVACAAGALRIVAARDRSGAPISFTCGQVFDATPAQSAPAHPPPGNART